MNIQMNAGNGLNGNVAVPNVSPPVYVTLATGIAAVPAQCVRAAMRGGWTPIDASWPGAEVTQMTSPVDWPYTTGAVMLPDGTAAALFGPIAQWEIGQMYGTSVGFNSAQGSGGSGYTNGTYNGVPLTGGNGSGAEGNITVAGGAITQVVITGFGAGYNVGDVLTAAASNIGGTGSGFSLYVAMLALCNALIPVKWVNHMMSVGWQPIPGTVSG
jgi:hypothetical protein